MKREVISDKIMVLGVDGLDPRLSRKYIKEGKMPNLQKIVEQGAQREDLVLLGSQPTVTPPQWTTLATGANPVVHGGGGLTWMPIPSAQADTPITRAPSPGTTYSFSVTTKLEKFSIIVPLIYENGNKKMRNLC